ncbi:hypothetical protein [Actinotalea sp.]|uniref:hypothetical protein n=1 Tax=Actinotalea sp. TaxID=1872145 RepID=UPI002CC838AE|nr:hypothetical protein [Actinotalea sp.]HQY33992.1 hypothetical protein [Actinotalea sp.]HRA50691.1 hypothetical protein [Actinotalea sp.]
MTARRRGARYWIGRYLPSELAATVGAIGGAWLAHRATGSLAAAAVVGTVVEGIGFYAVSVARMLAAELRSDAPRRDPAVARGAARRRRPTRVLRALLRTAALTVAEFGPAEALDTLLVRPGLMYVAPLVLGSPLLGWTVGKVAADVVFYAVAAACHLLTTRAADVAPPSHDRTVAPAESPVRAEQP